MSGLVLYGYFRSSAAYRVRIALELKRLAYETIAVHLRRGEQRAAAYRAINEQGLVPTLVLEDGTKLAQSLAIIEYLDEVQPEPPLLPPEPRARARVRALAQAIALDVHPLNNLRVQTYLREEFAAGEDALTRWLHHWVGEAFAPLEARLARDPLTGRFCHGDRPSLADICLVPQVTNNRRVGVEMSAYPTITRIDAACRELPAFAAAAPERQPDAE